MCYVSLKFLLGYVYFLMPGRFGGIQREELGFKEENKENAHLNGIETT